MYRFANTGLSPFSIGTSSFIYSLPDIDDSQNGGQYRSFIRHLAASFGNRNGNVSESEIPEFPNSDFKGKM
jgi:hypothetical protein